MSDYVKNEDEQDVDAESKNRQLEIFRERSKGKRLTTDQGVKVSHTDDSLKAGQRGPTLIEDFHFREKITHFDHERIPERAVHARGTGAHGEFRVYKSMAEFTKAEFLQNPEKTTPVFVRFSTVAGSRGSADTVRDVRGFATKFYTEDGNYDIVGNNIPVFFIQDAIKFPDIIHAVKPEPHNEMPQAASAHDTFWDFVAGAPETAHMIMWVMSDRAIPRSFRQMQGFGVNTFRFVNAQGTARFVKFHWKPMQGMGQLVWDEAQKLAGMDPDFHRRDLYDAIARGDFPEWELGVQMIEEADEFNFDFDVLDPTKIWPEEDVPVMPVGRMVLNRAPDNFFAEVEQAAFCPGNIVPGIDFSNDPLLQGRLFSYIDTQISRLGGPNFHEIPINRPIAAIHNNQRDAQHRMEINVGEVSYSPNGLSDNDPKVSTEQEGGFVHYQEKVEGKVTRARSESFGDHFSQATLFWNSMSDVEKDHIVQAFRFEVGKVEDVNTRKRIVDMFNNVDAMLATKIAEGVGVAAPEMPGQASITRTSAALSFVHFPACGIKTRRVAVLADDGYDHQSLAQVMERLEEQGAWVDVISNDHGTIHSIDGQQVKVDKTLLTTASVMYDAIFVPGGEESAQSLTRNGDAIHFVNEAFKHCKPIAAIGAGVDFIMCSDIQDIHLAASGTGDELIVDQGVVTVRDPSDLESFGDAFADEIQHFRHWAREAKMEVPA